MKCPGQDSQYWNGDAIYEENCPNCNASVEFYKDDTTRKCPSCKTRFVNPKLDFGCASYCQFAEQCLGSLPEDFLGSREDLLKDKVAVEVKRYLKTDFKSIRRVSSVAKYAEEISKKEGGNLGLILCCAFLQIVGPDPARLILAKVGASASIIEEINSLLDNKNQVTESSSLQEKIIHDAQALTRTAEIIKENAEGNSVDKTDCSELFFSHTAKELAEALC